LSQVQRFLISPDVAYTFNLLKSNGGLQGAGGIAVAADGFVDSVSAPDAKTAVFKLKRVNTPGLIDIVSQNIVPEHVWKDIKDPVKETNENPVATGPFTKISNFQSQVYQIDKNPTYWQADKVKVKGIRIPWYSGNDAAQLAFVKGDLDWSSSFFPNVEQSVIAKNPTDLHYWWPTVGSVTLFMVNTTKKPFDDVKVRKAIGMALNRQQMITLILKGLTKPADVTGLSEGFAAVKVQDPAKLGDWTTYNPAKANALLDSAGYKKGAGGIRQTADGTPLKFTLTMVNGFTDWIAIGPVIQQNLKTIGIDAQIKTMDVPVAFDSWMKGTFDMSMFFGVDATSPYALYRNIMSKDTVKPVGTDTPLTVNHWRFASSKADDLLTKYATSSDPAKQKEIAQQLQTVFADEAPVIPMWAAPQLYNYNTKRFSGWASKDNPYAAAMSIQDVPAELLILTALKPK